MNEHIAIRDARAVYEIDSLVEELLDVLRRVIARLEQLVHNVLQNNEYTVNCGIAYGHSWCGLLSRRSPWGPRRW